MNSTESIKILEACIKELKEMSDEEFERIKLEKGINQEKYSNRSYSHEGIELILPGTFEYNEYFKEEIFSKSISIEYDESFQSKFEFEIENNNIDNNTASAA